MTPNQERWAEASAIYKTHGDASPRFVAERLGASALAGDEAGIARWREIACRLNDIMVSASTCN